MVEINLNTIKVNNKIQIRTLDLVWFMVIPLININYYIASTITKNGHNLATIFDKVMKFNSIFIIPYVYWYVYIVIGFIIILIQSRVNYMRTFLSFFIGMGICYCIYYIYPTEIIRPNIENSNVLNYLVNIIYSADRSVNCFPSLHALTTYFIMRYTKYEKNKKNFYYTQIVGSLIILSTVFIKQHFVADIIGAMVICEVIIYFMNKVSEDRIKKVLDIQYKIKDKIVANLKSKIKTKAIDSDEKKFFSRKI